MRRLSGRFRLDGALGRGGMGTVFAATELRTGRRVAIKIPHHGDHARLAREAEVGARLRGPHAVRVYEAVACDDGPALVMERLDGVAVATLLAARGSVPASIAAEIGRQACDALAEAHALDIVHRDVKPANLFVTRGGVVKLLDFGASCALGDARITAAGALVGSPAYMAPEHMRPVVAVDPRSDLWSLGVALFEMVSGRLPFDSEVFPDLCLKILLDDPPAFDAPEPFAAIVRRCLDKEPSARFASAAELSAALAPLAEVGATAWLDAELDSLRLSQRLDPPAPRRRARAQIAFAAALSLSLAVSLSPEREPVAATAQAPVVAAAVPIATPREVPHVAIAVAPSTPATVVMTTQVQQPARTTSARRPPPPRATPAPQPPSPPPPPPIVDAQPAITAPPVPTPPDPLASPF